MTERLRAVRGAITVAEDTPDEVVSATRLVLEDMIARNGLSPDDMVSLIFTATSDVTSQFPAVAAREMGLTGVPLLCATQLALTQQPPSQLDLLLQGAQLGPAL